MSDKCYDTIKNVALFAAPVITLISAIFTIIGASWADKATAICAAVDTCLGSIVIVAKTIHDKKEKEEVDDE